MSDDAKRPDELSSDIDAEAILRRRDFLVKTALLSAGASLAAACPEAEVCLEPVPQDIGDAMDGGETSDVARPEVCLSDTPRTDTRGELPDVTQDARPEVCLEPPIDVAEDTEPDPGTSDVPTDNGPDSAPEVCLSPPLPDAGADNEVS